jgi:hypothetical protein
MRFASPRWLLGITFLLIVPGLFWGLPSAVTPQVDAPVPLGPLLFFAEYGKPQLDTIYPAFHQLLLLPVYAAAMAGYWVLGGVSHVSSVWPYGLRDVSAFFSSLILLSNLVSTCMGLGILYIGLRLVDSKNWAWVGIMMAALNGVFIYYCRVGNLDIPYNFWWAVSLFFLWGHFFHDKAFRASLLPAAAAAACAVGSKDQASGLAIGAGLLILLCPSGQAPSFLGRLRNAAFFAFWLAMFYAVVAILPHPVRWWYHLQYVLAGKAPTDIPRTPAGEVQMFGITLHWLVRVFTVPAAGLALAGVFALFRNGRGREFWVLFVPLATYYCVVVAQTRVFYPRFCIPFFVPVIVLVTHGAAFLADRFFVVPWTRLAWTTALIAFLVWDFAVSYVPVTYAQVFDMKRILAAELPAVLPPGSPMLISHMQSYNYPNRAVYESYALMMLPQDPIMPPSRHAANIFRPLDPKVAYFLWGSGNAGLPWNPVGDYPPLSGELVREWRYPAWVKERVLVPCIYEFALYRRTDPLPAF